MGAVEVQKKNSRQGKLNEKNACTPINPKRYSCYGLKKIHKRNLITKTIPAAGKFPPPPPPPITFLMDRPLALLRFAVPRWFGNNFFPNQRGVFGNTNHCKTRAHAEQIKSEKGVKSRQKPQLPQEPFIPNGESIPIVK